MTQGGQKVLSLDSNAFREMLRSEWGYAQSNPRSLQCLDVEVLTSRDLVIHVLEQRY